MEQIQIIGVSPYLVSGAAGHYESLHKALFEGLKLHKRIDHPLYLGSRQTPSGIESWYLPVVPARLTSKFKVVDFKYFKTLLNLAKSSGSTRVFVSYEGSLFTVYLFSALLRLRPHAIALVNIFDNQQHAQMVESKLKAKVFRVLLSNAVKGIENQLVLSGDTQRFASRMQVSTNIPIKLFPMFSILKP
jgi:hypothetical protein